MKEVERGLDNTRMAEKAQGCEIYRLFTRSASGALEEEVKLHIGVDIE